MPIKPQKQKGKRGGARPGAGRKPGSLDPKTYILNAAVEAAMKRIDGEGGFKGDAVEFLQAVYRENGIPAEVRIVAARSAAPYERPRLSSAEVKIQQPIDELTDDELHRALANAAKMAEGEGSTRSGTGETGGGPEPGEIPTKH